MVREMFAHLLVHELGLTLAAECTTLADGEAAVRRERPQLAIVDWRLPDGRGFDLVRRASAEVRDTRWLFVSATEQADIVREAVRLGVQGFVMKRADLATLREAVERVLAGEDYFCATSTRLLSEGWTSTEAPEPEALTPRERDVLQGFARGENPKVVAARLGISAKTAQNHLTAVKDKLRLREPADLLRYAIKHGLADV